MSAPITLTFDQLLRAMPTINKMATSVTKPQSLVYQLAKIIRAAGPELQHFETKRTELLTTHGTPRASTPDEAEQLGDSRVYDIPAEKRDAFQQELRELLAVPVELSIFPIPEASLEHVELTAVDLLALEPLIRQTDV